MDDADLVEAVRSGDRDAWARVYDRYADRLHDYCWSVLRDEADAADATHDTFITAMQKLHQLRDPSRLRPWLYSIARRHALARARRRQRMTPAELPDAVQAGAGPAEVAEHAELRELVWAAAEGLSARDRSVLDLHLRQGLEGADLGEALGTTAANAHVLLSRLRDQVERALGAYLLARTDREQCPELDALLSGWDQTFTPVWRKRIARHVDGCAICGERRRTAVSPLALLAGVPVVGAPAALRQRVLDDLELVSHQRPLERQGRRRLLAGAAVIALVVGGVLLWDAVVDDTGELTSAGVTPTTSAGPSSTTAVPSTAPALTPTTRALGGSPTTRPPTRATTTSAAPATTTTAAPATLSAAASSSSLVTNTQSTCAPTTTGITATTSGNPGTPVLMWTAPDGTSGQRRMSGGPSQWSASLGPFASPGNAQWWVVAGQLRTPTRSVVVTRCGA
jgi:RNA polymerase sigma factor (sigma-70 family)